MWSLIIDTWNSFLTYMTIPETTQLFVAAAIGLLLGVERELNHKEASIRTFALISAGSCLLTILSVGATHLAGAMYDVSRIAAQIVSGIGFIGGGVIFKTQDKIEGITTAAMIWFAAAIGMCCGFNKLREAIIAMFLYITILAIGSIFHRITGRIISKEKEK